MRIFIRGIESFNRYQTRILNAIWKEIECDKCVIISRNCDKKDKYNGRYIEIPYSYAKGRRDEDVNQLIPVPEKILLGMREYEAKIFDLVMRECDRPIYTLEECQDKYYSELRYWYHIICMYQFDCMIFFNSPHMLHDYVIYCIAQIMKIPSIMLIDSFFPGRIEYGSSFELLGRNISDEYKRLINLNVQPNLPCDLQDAYNKYRNKFWKKNEKQIDKTQRRAFTDFSKKISYLNKTNIQKRRISMIKNILAANDKGKRDKLIDEFKYHERIYRRCKIYERTAVDVNTYHDYDTLNTKSKERYIYFALQSYPELALVPRLSAFYEQRFSIAILAKAADKLGYKVYVKEHWVQSYRNQELYQFIKSLSNVRLISPNENNVDLMKNSIAVSTATGSCSREAMFNGIPSIVFADGSWSGMPGCFRVHDMETCMEAIKKIEKKEYEISDYNIKVYLQAINNSTVIFNQSQAMTKFNGSPFDDKESIDNISKFLIGKLKEIQTE